MMTIPCNLPRSGNSLLELSKQHFADQPVDSTPVIINAENGNLPIHFINQSDHEVVITKYSYVRAMEKVQESNQDTLPSNTSPEPVSQHASPKCLAHNDLLPKITPLSLKIILQKLHVTLPSDPKFYFQNLLPLVTLYLLMVYCQLTRVIPQ